MKLIVAIINPQRLGFVSSALRRAKVPGVTVTSAKGFGKDNREIDWDMSGDMTDKIRIEVVIDDDACQQIVAAIQKSASTGRSGDGIIYVQDVNSSIRIGFGDSTGMHKVSN